MDDPWSMSDIYAVDLLRLFYLMSSVSILLVSFTPSLSSRFLAYGARETAVKPKLRMRSDDVSDVTLESESRLSRALDAIASIKVPHQWFYHFYVVSILSSLIWLHQIITHGALFRAISVGRIHDDSSMTVSQVALCWALLFFQSCRRCYECLMLSKPSASKMWLGHYVIGIVFYVATGIAIWIEGVPALRRSADIYIDMQADQVLFKLDSSLFVIIFFLASKVQYDCHTYLSNLKKYTLPTQGAFQYLIAPHYAAECVIYLCLARLAAPGGTPLNGTMVYAFLFVTCNLEVSARGTKRWMELKFGKENVSSRWNLP